MILITLVAHVLLHNRTEGTVCALAEPGFNGRPRGGYRAVARRRTSPGPV